MTTQDNARALHLYAETSDAPLCHAIGREVKSLMRHVDRVARDLAKSRADWMDDPEDERYSDWHASDREQFSQAERLHVLRSMLSHHIEELLIQDAASTTTTENN